MTGLLHGLRIFNARSKVSYHRLTPAGFRVCLHNRVRSKVIYHRLTPAGFPVRLHHRVRSKASCHQLTLAGFPVCLPSGGRSKSSNHPLAQVFKQRSQSELFDSVARDDAPVAGLVFACSSC